MTARRRTAVVAIVLAAFAVGCDSAPSSTPPTNAPSSSTAAPTTPPSSPPTAGDGAVDTARLAAVVAAVPADDLEVREGGPRECATDEDCPRDLVRTTLYTSEELPERTWEAAAGWVAEEVGPWHDAGWSIAYSVCAPARAGSALVKELEADGGAFVALVQIDTRSGTRSIEVTVPLAAEGADPWRTTRTMLPDAACWQEAAPKDLVEQSTPPDTTPPTPT